MKTREYYISLLTSHAEELKKNFGVKSLRLFGSVSRNEQKDGIWMFASTWNLRCF